MLSQLRIVLIETSHPGNIGATARAMKTMGLQQLYLVRPRQFPDGMATAMAAGADSILVDAKVVETLEEAIRDCTLVYGTSARLREYPLPELNPKEAAAEIGEQDPADQFAIIFGSEQNGLTNQEIQFCHRQIYVPANPDYPTLNIAATVQVICYEMRMHLADIEIPQREHDRFATSEEVEGFIHHLNETLHEVDFFLPEAEHHLMHRLRRLFNRTRLERTEINILRGILTAVGRAIKS